jgi:guanylate kinase
MPEQGNLYIISAPSGTGKTTLVKALIESIPDITVSISHTTRGKRSAEVHGVNYYFISKDEFSRMVKHNEFLEHATIFNYHYGTSKKWVQETLAKGIDVILEIEWQGRQQIQLLFPDCINIFILPPSRKALAERIETRNQDKPEVIKQRLEDARIITSHIREYDYIIINDDFATALNDLKSIILSGRLIESRQIKKYAKLLKELQM